MFLRLWRKEFMGYFLLSGSREQGLTVSSRGRSMLAQFWSRCLIGVSSVQVLVRVCDVLDLLSGWKHKEGHDHWLHAPYWLGAERGCISDSHIFFSLLWTFHTLTFLDPVLMHITSAAIYSFPSIQGAVITRKRSNLVAHFEQNTSEQHKEQKYMKIGQISIVSWERS